jgi:hypothetical protein
MADDGTDFNSEAASIRAQIDGTPGSNDVPGRLSFATTADGAASPTERMRIDSAGYVGIGTTAPDHIFHVQDIGANSFNTKFVLDLENTRRSGYTEAAIELASEYGTPGAGNFRTSAIAAQLIGDQTATDIVFYSESTERMRITSTGLVHIGDSDVPSDYLDVSISSASARAARFTQKSATGNILALEYSGVSPDDNTRMFLTCSDGTANRAIIYSDGDVWTADAGTLTSDERLKTNIVNASDKLADVMKLQVRNYEWTPEYHPAKVGEKKIGFIAQELETVFPSLISEHDIAPDNSVEEELYTAEDDTQYYADGDEIPDGKEVGDVKTESQIPDGKEIGDVKVEAKAHEPTMRKAYKDAFTPILVKALQEVTTRLEAAEAKITALESA